MKNLETMINDVRNELKIVYASDTIDGQSIANLYVVIKTEEKEGMTDERRTFLYNSLICLISSRADNAVKINALKTTLRSLEDLKSVYEVTK